MWGSECKCVCVCMCAYVCINIMYTVNLCVGVSGRLTPNQHVFWWSPDGPASPLFLVVHPLMIQCSAWALGRAPIFFRRLMESFRDISLDCSTHTHTKSTGAEQSACIWMPAESISRICCEIILTKTRSQLSPIFSALKWSSVVWRANSSWRGCLQGDGCF